MKTKKELELEKEIKKSKRCKWCKQLQEDFKTDCDKHTKAKAELKGIKDTKAQTLADVMKIIDEEIEEEHKAEKNNRNSIPPWTIYKELVYLKRLLAKLQETK